MLLIFHIAVALAGLAFSTLALLAPSKAKIKATYGFIGLTLASGTYLVISTHAGILHSCVSGLVYVCLASSGALVGQRRLAHEKVR
jgi:hypothetical protein